MFARCVAQPKLALLVGPRLVLFWVVSATPGPDARHHPLSDDQYVGADVGTERSTIDIDDPSILWNNSTRVDVSCPYASWGTTWHVSSRSLNSCGIVDNDLDDVETCLEQVGDIITL